VSLEFNKVIDQVQRMGRHLGKKQNAQSNRMQLALEWFGALSDINAVHERIRLIRQSSISGYRGAAPILPETLSEIINGVGSLPEAPPSATVVAADGSQVYPDPHAAATYYLINVGVFIYHHGEAHLPAQFTTPELVYNDKRLLDEDGRPITNQTVNARRSVEEMRWLAKQAWELRDEARPLVCLRDGNLLQFFGATEVAFAHQIEQDYMDALRQLCDVRAYLCGYVDVPRSTYMISLLHLMSLQPQEINEVVLKTNGELEGLTDAQLFEYVLENPGERSALMVQNSPQNAEYMKKGAEFEIACFYLNVGHVGRPVIARVDVPMWVAHEPHAVNAIHALLVYQSQIVGGSPYPYALTRADELARVSMKEKSQLDQLIDVEMLRNGIMPEKSMKLEMKALARGNRRQHKLRG
jgi:NurA domain